MREDPETIPGNILCNIPGTLAQNALVCGTMKRAHTPQGRKPSQHVGQVLRMLKMNKAPTMLGLLVGYLFLSSPEENFADSLMEPKYFHAEAFAGAQRVTKEFQAAGLAAVAMDVSYGPQWDVNSNLGFINTMKSFLQTRTAALLAPVCSSFTHMNSGTAKRTFASPLGDMHQPTVRYANKLANRVILLLWLLQSLGILFLLEQPKGSFLEQLPRFQEFIRTNRIRRKLIHMKDSLHGLSLNA